ncbi:MAG TPA: lipocalin-like domain-containing protein [Psychromonas sp.]
MSDEKMTEDNNFFAGRLLLTILLLLFFVSALLLLFVFLPGNQLPGNNPLHAQTDAKQYQLPSENSTVIFPEAHWPHKNFRHEWWYLSAILKTEDGLRFATQWTLFRTAVNKQHWYFAHAALADTQLHRAEFRDGREELGNVELKKSPFSARIDDWSWQSSAHLFPAELSYGSAKYFLAGGLNDDPQALRENWQVKITLSTSKPFYLQGVKGFSKKHPNKNIASFYYSQPFVEVKGKILWQGEWQNITGEAWFDREWGSAMLAEEQQGWDWFSLRLNKDQALMIYRIRSSQDDFLYGSLMNSNGDIKTIKNEDIKLTSREIGEGGYPRGFTLKVEPFAIDMNIDILNDQQIMRFGIEYFEGMATFSGSHRGEGFVEMTGYH